MSCGVTNLFIYFYWRKSQTHLFHSGVDRYHLALCLSCVPIALLNCLRLLPYLSLHCTVPQLPPVDPPQFQFQFQFQLFCLLPQLDFSVLFAAFSLLSVVLLLLLLAFYWFLLLLSVTAVFSSGNCSGKRINFIQLNIQISAKFSLLSCCLCYVFSTIFALCFVSLYLHNIWCVLLFAFAVPPPLISSHLYSAACIHQSVLLLLCIFLVIYLWWIVFFFFCSRHVTWTFQLWLVMLHSACRNVKCNMVSSFDLSAIGCTALLLWSNAALLTISCHFTKPWVVTCALLSCLSVVLDLWESKCEACSL